MKNALMLFVASLFIRSIGLAQPKTEADIIIDRYRQFIFLSLDAADSVNAMPMPDAKGRWSDINYTDEEKGLWQPSIHLQRTRRMAINWADRSSRFYHAAGLKKMIDVALDDWFRNRYKSSNWWHNEIGIPRIMRDITILMKDSLDEKQFSHCLQVLGQYKVNGTGANLVWSADLGLHYGALTRNTALMRKCRDTIASCLTITTGEGVQPDFSFHQHGKRLQMYHYGGAFFIENTRLAWQLTGTSLQFPAEGIQVLVRFVLHGWQWMARGITTVPGTIDRAASRKNALHSADIRKYIPLLYQVEPDSIPAFKKMLLWQQGQRSLKGYRYFPYSDFTAFHQPGYSFLLKTVSQRTLLTEDINGENQKGYLLNVGDGYFMTDGTEYFNLMPFWDWEKLPGITNIDIAGKKEIIRQPFVGNVSNGAAGAAVMEYALQQGTHRQSLHKLWASWKNITVSLIAGIEPGGMRAAVFTTIDQCRWQGPVTINARHNIVHTGTHAYPAVKWLHHRNFAYIPLYPDSITLELERVSGRWSDINRSESAALLYDSVFMPSIVHRTPASGYVVAYAPSAAAAEKIATHPSWKVLRNDTLCQAVGFSDDTRIITMYGSSTVSLSDGTKVSSSIPCLLLCDRKNIFASDPAHTGGDLTVSLNGVTFHALLPADGTSAKCIRQ